MSRYSFDKRVRCWTCKANGVDRFFDGNAERLLHESKIHAPRILAENLAKKNAAYLSINSSATSFGYASPLTSKRNESGFEYGRGPSTKSLYDELKEMQDGSGVGLKLTEISSRFCTSETVYESDREIKNYENASNNIRMQQMLGELDARKSMIKKLRNDLEHAEMTLKQSRGRESLLEDELVAAEGEIKKIGDELNHVSEIAENERMQRHQVQKEFKSLVQSHNFQLMKLQEEFEMKRSASNQADHSEKLLAMERSIRRLKKEIENEKRLKLEAKRDRDEYQKEVDELLVDNNNIRKRLKQYQHELQSLQEEHRELMDEFDAIASNNNNGTLDARLLEAEAFLERKFNVEKASFANDIEKYRKQCEMLEDKCKLYEKQLQTAMFDIKEARNELADVESYRQGDIDRLLKEKDSLKMELKAKKVALQSLEVSNDELASKLNEKEKHIRKLEKLNSASHIIYHKKIDSAILESNFEEKINMIEEMQAPNEEIKEQNVSLLEQNQKLQQHLMDKVKILVEKEERVAELEKKNEELQSTKSHVEKLEQKVKILEESCRKMNDDLEAKREECEDAAAKQSDMLQKFQEKENQYLELENEMNETEDKYSKSEKIRNSCELQVVNLLEKQNRISTDLQIIRNKLETLTKEKDAMATENKELKNCLEVRQHVALNHEFSDTDELHELQESLDDMKEREKKLQVHNHDLKKRLDANEAQQSSNEEQIASLNNDVEKYKKEAICSESEIEKLRIKVENLQKSLDDVFSILADSESNFQLLSAKSSKMAYGFTEENKNLKNELNQANNLMQEKQNEIDLLKKRIKNDIDLSEFEEKRNAEVKNGEETRKLVEGRERLEGKCAEMKNMLDVFKNKEEVDQRPEEDKVDVPENAALEYDYESDFEDEIEQADSERSLLSQAYANNEIDDDEDVTLGEDDDLREMLVEERCDELHSISHEYKEDEKTENNECATDEKSDILVMNKEFCEDNEVVTEHATVDKHYYFEDEETLEIEQKKDVDAVTEDITVEDIDVEKYDYTEDIEIDEKSQEEAVTEDITVEEIELEEYDYFEDIEEEEKSQEMGVPAQTSIGTDDGDILDDFLSIQRKHMPSKRPALDKDEGDNYDDTLDDFLSKQKKGRSSLTEKKRKMAADSALDEDLDIENLIADIEADNKAEADSKFEYEAASTGDCEAYNVDQTRAGRCCSNEPLSLTTNAENFKSCTPHRIPSHSFEGKLLLPPLRAKPRSLPPMLGAKKPLF